MSIPTFWQMLTETFRQWSEDKPFQLAAALAYYTLFSLAPLLLIAITIAGLVFGREATEQQILTTFGGLVGPQGAQAIQGLLHSASKPQSSVLGTILGVVTLLIGAGGVVGQLQDSLNLIWGVAPKPGRGLLGMVHDRFVSLAMVLGIGFLLLVSLVVSTGLSAAIHFMSGVLAGGEALWHMVELIVSFGFVTLLFALIYKILPAVVISWRDVWVGAGMTGLLFTVGKFLIGLYLGRSGVSSAYGAAGSLVLVLVWVYYSGLIFFFGAEFTQVYANTYGTGVKPGKDAMVVEDKAGRAQEEVQDGKEPRVHRPHEQEPSRILPLTERQRRSHGQPVVIPFTAKKRDVAQQGRERQDGPRGWSDARRGQPYSPAVRPDATANGGNTEDGRLSAPPADDRPQDGVDPRVPLTETLTLLEERVRETVADAHASGAEIAAQIKDLVDTTVEAGQQTVEGVQSLAEEIVEHITHSVGETAVTVQRTVALRSQVQQHPWRIVGGALLVGYLLGSWGSSRTSTVSTTDSNRAPAHPPTS